MLADLQTEAEANMQWLFVTMNRIAHTPPSSLVLGIIIKVMRLWVWLDYAHLLSKYWSLPYQVYNHSVPSDNLLWTSEHHINTVYDSAAVCCLWYRGDHDLMEYGDAYLAHFVHAERLALLNWVPACHQQHFCFPFWTLYPTVSSSGGVNVAICIYNTLQ